MKIETITNINQQLNQIKSNEIIATYTPLSDSFNTLIDNIASLSNNIFSMYDLYFNESSIPNGEGLNLLKSNSFCESIPKEYIYSKIRTLLLNNISIITSGLYFENHFKIKIENLKSFVENKQIEFNNWTPPIQPTNPPSGSQESGGSEPPPKSKVELFWEKEGLLTIQQKIDDIQSTQLNLKNKITGLSNLIQEWLDFGMLVILKIAITQNVFAFSSIDIESEDLFSLLDKNQISVNNYAPEIINALNIVKDVLNENLNDQENITDKIRDKVLESTKVKETSQIILNQIQNNLNIIIGN